MITTNITDYPFETASAHEKLKIAAINAQDKAQAALETGEEYVRSHPFPTVLGALLIGAFVGAAFCYRGSEKSSSDGGIREWLASCPHGLFLGKKIDVELPSKSSLHHQMHDIVSKLRFWQN